MTSAAKLAANQANSQHSTGPQSPAGKAASAANSTKHGFRSTAVLLPGEDPALYQALLDELTQHFGQPRDLTESRCLREMADAEWRLRRARRFQEHMLHRKIHELFEVNPEADILDLQIQAHQTLAADPAFLLFLKYEKQFQRQYNDAYRTWTRYQSDRRSAQQQDLDLALQVGLNAPFLDHGPGHDPSHSPNEPNAAHVLTGRHFQPANPFQPPPPPSQAPQNS